MAGSFDEYKGLKRLEPPPAGDGGQALNHNFTYIADALENKLTRTEFAERTTINVLDHGLVNDGETDNSAALTALIDQFPKGSGDRDYGMRLYFPRGKYWFEKPAGNEDACIETPLPGNMVFQGDGIGSTIWQSSNTLMKAYHACSANGTIFRDMSIWGTWDVNSEPTRGANHGLHLHSPWGPYRMLLDNIEFKYIEGSSIFSPEYSLWETLFHKVNFRECGRHSLEVLGFGNNTQFNQCTWPGARWDRSDIMFARGRINTRMGNWFMPSVSHNDSWWKFGGPRITTPPCAFNGDQAWEANREMRFGDGVWVEDLNTMFMVANGFTEPVESGNTEPDWSSAPNHFDTVEDNEAIWINMDCPIKSGWYPRVGLYARDTNFEHTIAPVFIGYQPRFFVRDSSSYIKGTTGLPGLDLRDITSVDTTSDEVTIEGEHADEFQVGSWVTIHGSSGNDGDYKVASSSESNGATTIGVDGDLSDPTSDGGIVAHQIPDQLDRHFTTWPKETEVKVGQKTLPNNPFGNDTEGRVPYIAICIEAGTTGDTEPTWGDFGEVINDGTVVWRMWWPHTILTLSWSRYKNIGNRRFEWSTGSFLDYPRAGADVFYWKNALFHDLRQMRGMDLGLDIGSSAAAWYCHDLEQRKPLPHNPGCANLGDGPPAANPSYLGETWLDLDAGQLYIATGTASLDDWKEV